MKTRIHTIVWGALLLGIATMFLVGSLVDLSGLNPALIVVVAAVGLGTLLVVAAILGSVLRIGRRPDTAAAAAGSEASGAFGPQP